MRTPSTSIDMKRKKLNKLINEYRATAHWPGRSLAQRPRDAAIEAKSTQRKAHLGRTFWYALACCWLLAIVLPVALVFGLPSNTWGTMLSGYTKNNTVSIHAIDSIAVYNATYGTHLPDFPLLDGATRCYEIKENNLSVGMQLVITETTDTQYHKLFIAIYVSDYRMDEKTTFDSELAVGQTVVKYATELSDDLVFTMEFEYGGYACHARVFCQPEVTLRQALADCFGIE